MNPQATAPKGDPLYHSDSRHSMLKINDKENLVVESELTITLEETMNDEGIYKVVRNFSLEEHTEENLEFIMMVKEFERKKNRKLAHVIIQKHIVNGAPKEINIDHDTRIEILTNAANYSNPSLKSGNLDFKLFEKAYNIVAEMIKNETLNRFNNSGYYNKTDIINPRQFRRFMIFSNVLNIIFFVILTVFALVTSYDLIDSYMDDTHDIYYGVSIKMYDRDMTYNGMLAAYKPSKYDVFKSEYDAAQIGLISAFDNLEKSDGHYAYSPAVSDASKIMSMMEANAFELIRNNNSIAAQEIYESPVYEKNKEILAQGIDDMIAKINHEIDTSKTKHQAMIISTIVIAVVFFLYTIPATLYIIKQEKQHTGRMLELAKSLDRRLKIELENSSSASRNEASNNQHNSDICSVAI